MKLTKKVCQAVLVFLVIAVSNTIVLSQSVDLDKQERALDIIAAFADKFCKSVPLEGTVEKIELSTQGKAELSKLLKKIAGLGFEGAAEYQKTEYVGALQKDIAILLQSNLTCRTTIWKDLKDKLLEKTQPLPSTATYFKPPNVKGDYNSVININGGGGNTATSTINITN